MADGPGTAQWSIAGKPTVSFSGTFKSGRLHGNGTMIAAGGDRYEGEYKDGMRDGKGIYVSASGERYEGAYKYNQRDGQGALIDAQGRRTEGVFQAGVLVSKQQPAAVSSGAPAPFCYRRCCGFKRCRTGCRCENWTRNNDCVGCSISR